MLSGQNFAIDFQDGRGWVIEQGLDFGVDAAELSQQFTHVLRAATGGCLIRHRGHPVNQIVLEQAAQSHQHARHGTVAADVVFDATMQRLLDDIQIDRIEHDDGIVFHPQAGGRINPISVPAGCAQLGENLGGVIAPLTAEDDVAFF